MARLLRRLGVDSERLRIASRYNASYYEAGSGRQTGRTGYGTYTRENSNAEAAAWLAWSYFDCDTVLDIGCAMGHFVAATSELGMATTGFDLSRDAIAMADDKVQPHLSVAALPDRLPADDASTDLIVSLETLEHLRPKEIPAALKELRRISNSYVLATIPSVGRNTSGPNGWFNGKVRPELLAKYEELGIDYDGPIPFDDLAVDDQNLPIEGHLTIASYRWWRTQFEEAGFVSCDTQERYLTHEISRFGLAEFWCVYVFRTPNAAELNGPVRSLEQRQELEQRWDLVSSNVPKPVLEASETRLNEVGIHLENGQVR